MRMTVDFMLHCTMDIDGETEQEMLEAMKAYFTQQRCQTSGHITVERAKRSFFAVEIVGRPTVFLVRPDLDSPGRTQCPICGEHHSSMKSSGWTTADPCSCREGTPLDPNALEQLAQVGDLP